MTLTTSPGFWRSFDRDHEPLVQSEPTSQSTHTIIGHCTCQTCGMPCHLEMHKSDDDVRPPVPELAWHDTQTVWVARHGPAPYSPKLVNKALAGTTPVIELPDATAVVGGDPSTNRRHMFDPADVYTHEKNARLRYVRSTLCAIRDPYGILVMQLGHCWNAAACENCKKALR